MWEAFPYMGSLFICGKSLHTRDVFHKLEVFPYMGSLPMYGKCSHRRQVFPYVGSLPMYGKSSHIREVFPYLGRRPIVLYIYIYTYIYREMESRPIYGKAYRMWEDFPYMRRLQVEVALSLRSIREASTETEDDKGCCRFTKQSKKASVFVLIIIETGPASPIRRWA
jgi:hypothetical protein